MDQTRLLGLLNAWSARHGVAFVWDSNIVVTYTGSRGAWRVRTRSINRRDDWITVHPGDGDLVELELVADAGHVEVVEITLDELARRLDGALDWFQSWEDFMAEGPGLGH